MKIATVPLKVLLTVLNFLGPRAIEYLIYLRLASKLLPLNTFWQWKLFQAQRANTAALLGNAAAENVWLLSTKKFLVALRTQGMALWANAGAWAGNWVAMTAGIAGIAIVVAGLMSMKDPLKAITLVALGLAAAFGAMWVAGTGGAAAAPILAGLAAVSGAIAASGAIGMGLRSTGMAEPTIPSVSGNLGTGGAGIPDLTSGIPTPQMGGASGGVTINVAGNVYDKEGFSTVLAESLPGALRIGNDAGSI